MLHTNHKTFIIMLILKTHYFEDTLNPRHQIEELLDITLNAGILFN